MDMQLIDLYETLSDSARRELEDMGDKLCARIALLDATDGVVRVLWHEWLGINKLFMDDEL